jgi:hypothetical protein
MLQHFSTAAALTPREYRPTSPCRLWGGLSSRVLPLVWAPPPTVLRSVAEREYDLRRRYAAAHVTTGSKEGMHYGTGDRRFIARRLYGGSLFLTASGPPFCRADLSRHRCRRSRLTNRKGWDHLVPPLYFPPPLREAEQLVPPLVSSQLRNRSQARLLIGAKCCTNYLTRRAASQLLAHPVCAGQLGEVLAELQYKLIRR